MMKAKQLWFTEPCKVKIKEQELPEVSGDEVLVESILSGISAGTEMLVYRGQLPQDQPLDISINAFQGLDASYPLPYGYSCVGKIINTGENVDDSMQGQRVFAFQPHASHFICKPEQLVFLPDAITDEAGVLLANMETAINLFIDGAAQTNEKIAILGAGIVGQLLNVVLNQQLVNEICVIDHIGARRDLAARQKQTVSKAPGSDDLEEFDLIFELSGNPQALNEAINISKFAARIIVGSWYGNKEAALNLGGKFHRERLRIFSSQVSTISPEHAGQWTKELRLQEAMRALEVLDVEAYITHRFPFSQAEQAYQLLEERSEEKTDKQTIDLLQVILTYED